MKMKEVLEKPLKADVKESMGKVVGRMLKNKKDYVFVFQENEFKGVVHARDLVVKTAEPEKTRIESFVQVVHPVPENTPVKELVEIVMVNDYMVLPVECSGEIHGLTKMGLLGLVKKDPLLKGKTAKDVMKFPYFVESGDSIGIVKSVIKELGISRVPVVENGKVVGLVESVDLLKAVIERERPERGDMKSEKSSLEDVKISSFMRKVFPKVEPDFPLTNVIDLMVEGRSAVVVEGDGKLQGIVTPRNVFKVLGLKKEGVYVTISGIRDEDSWVKRVLDKEITNSVRRIGRLTKINYMVFHVDKHRETGKRTKYSVKARVSTSSGRFFAQSYEWDLPGALRGTLDKLEREIGKKSEMEKEHTLFMLI